MNNQLENRISHQLLINVLLKGEKCNENKIPLSRRSEPSVSNSNNVRIVNDKIQSRSRILLNHYHHQRSMLSCMTRSEKQQLPSKFPTYASDNRL